MPISSLRINTEINRTQEIISELQKIPGIEIHFQEKNYLIVTAERLKTSDHQHLSSRLERISGVLEVQVVYPNMEKTLLH